MKKLIAVSNTRLKLPNQCKISELSNTEEGKRKYDERKKLLKLDDSNSCSTLELNVNSSATIVQQ